LDKNSFETEFVKSQYEEMIKDNTKDSEPYSFEQVAEIFNDKISTEEYVRFRHPSYSEALPFLLERRYNTVQERQKPFQQT
jgi:hypothetical protein